MVRKSVSKISPTTLYVFWVHPWFWAPSSAQESVYLKYHRPPHRTFFGVHPWGPWFWRAPGISGYAYAKSAMGSAVVGVHRHHESAIPTLLAPCGGRVIHRTFRKRSLCVNGSPALFPDRGVQFGATVWRNVRKARHFAVSAHRRSDPAKIDREAPPNGAFERSWGPKTRDVPK